MIFSSGQSHLDSVSITIRHSAAGTLSMRLRSCDSSQEALETYIGSSGSFEGRKL